MTYHKGDRVSLVAMGPDPDPVPSGTTGTVVHVSTLRFPGEPEQEQISVDWDNGRRLACLVPPDVLRMVRE